MNIEVTSTTTTIKKEGTETITVSGDTVTIK